MDDQGRAPGNRDERTVDAWIEALGPSDFSVTPDSSTSASALRVHYWLCGGAEDDLRVRAKELQALLDAGTIGDADRALFCGVVSAVSELALDGNVCDALRDARSGRWHPYGQCSRHAAAFPLPKPGPRP